MTVPGSAEYDIEYVGFVTGEGGDALQMLQLAHQMQLRGRKVRVIVPASDTTVSFAEKADLLDVDCVRSDWIRAETWGPRQNVRSMFRLVRSLTAPIVHIHTGNSCLPRAMSAAWLLTRRRRAFVTVHSPYETVAPTSLRGRLWGWAVRTTVHAVATPSEHARLFQLECGVPSERVETIRNAIDTEAFAQGDGSRIRAELGITPDQPLVVFTSRIESQKRPHDAVHIMSKVAIEHPDCLLVFVGSGDQSDSALAEASELNISEHVRHVGFRTDIADWLAASTVWLLPTERENFSVAVLEALAAGCAVATTECPGNDEVVVDDENALTFDVGDIDGGAVAVRRLIEDRALRNRLSDGGRASVQRFSVDAMVDQHVRLYARFVDSH